MRCSVPVVFPNGLNPLPSMVIYLSARPSLIQSGVVFQGWLIDMIQSVRLVI